MADQRGAAFFDMDGTLTATNVIFAYRAFVAERLPPGARLGRTLRLLFDAPRLLALEMFSRRRFNLAFYRHYRGIARADFAAWAREVFRPRLRARLFPAAAAELARHRAEGRPVVIVTGSPREVVAPFAAELGVTDLITVTLLEADGRFTGELAGREPNAEAERARLVREYAAARGIALADSWAYGDSVSDAAMLALVGHPVAVNPSRGLRRLAAREGWAVEEWRAGTG